MLTLSQQIYCVHFQPAISRRRSTPSYSYSHYSNGSSPLTPVTPKKTPESKCGGTSSQKCGKKVPRSRLEACAPQSAAQLFSLRAAATGDPSAPVTVSVVSGSLKPFQHVKQPQPQKCKINLKFSEAHHIHTADQYSNSAKKSHVRVWVQDQE